MTANVVSLGAKTLLFPGDCLDVLRSFQDNTIHAIVTDPPYGLAEHKPAVLTTTLTAWLSGDRASVPDQKGFMGRSWDGFVPPPAVWDECLRVLKPGGHMLVFAGSRTVDLMGLSIRLAGFELRDEIMWCYGCLTADAEILTERGWRPGVEVEQGERVAQWDHETGTISLAPVAETYRAPWDGPMRVLRSTDTDQVLTPNHRVYHRPRQRRMTDGIRRQWYEQEWQVAEAGQLSTWNPVQLPIAGEHDGPGIGGVDYAALLGWVWTEGGFDHSGTGVRVYQSSVNSEKVAEIDSLLDRLGAHKRYDYERTYTRRSGELHPHVATTWFFSGDLANRVRADLPGKRPNYELLWRMTQAEKRAFRDAALAGDGHCDSQGVWQFYQRHEDDLVWFSTLLTLVGQTGKVGMRPDRDNGTVYVRDRSTTELQARHLRDSSEYYTGEVWCVRVPTGAFVARRNGRVFITGNSGFPKSLDVSKAIDKAGGVSPQVQASVLRTARERAGLSRDEVAKSVGCTPASVRDWEEGRARAVGRAVEYITPSPDYRDKLADLLGYTADERQITGATTDRRGDGTVIGLGHSGAQYGDATTDAAKQWAGFGTALKPSHEPIICAQKPFNLVPSWELVSRVHHELGGLIWLCISRAKRAALTSPSSLHEQPGETCVSALASAAMGPSPDESARTDTFNSPAVASTCLSIATSWSAILGALSAPMTTFTTSTESSTTTALRTLSSLLGPITSPSTMPSCGCLLGGPRSSASSVAPVSSDAWSNWLDTLSRSVHESAIEGIALAASNVLASFADELSNEPPVNTAQRSATTPYRDESSTESSANTAVQNSTPVDNLDASARSDAPGLRPTKNRTGHEPILVCRKPLTGTVAANVQEHGTGALNIDASLVPGQAQPFGNGTARTAGIMGSSEPRGAWTPTRDGRWPTNVVLVHSPDCDEECAEGCPVAEMDQQSGISSGGASPARRSNLGYKCDGNGTDTGVRREYDSGGASRFFKTFRHDSECVFKETLPGCERVPAAEQKSRQTAPGRDSVASPALASTPPNVAGKSESSPSGAATAELSSSPTPETNESSAPENAATPLDVHNVLRAKYADNLCDSCATAIARSVAATQQGHSVSQALGLPSTAGSSERILTRSLAHFAADLASSDITSTTTESTTSLGCAVDAINAYTTKASAQLTRRSEGNGQEPPLHSAPPMKYQAKAPTKERPKVDGKSHPTVKPLELMRWLVRLVGGQPGSVILDPFAGTGTTGQAAELEGFASVLIERDELAVRLIQKRFGIAAPENGGEAA